MTCDEGNISGSDQNGQKDAWPGGLLDWTHGYWELHGGSSWQIPCSGDFPGSSCGGSDAAAAAGDSF